MAEVHDLGGREGFGPVPVEPDEPVFHADWERRVFGMTEASNFFNVDEFRRAIESMEPDSYLSSPYYGRWLWAVERLALEKGIIDEGELADRLAAVAETADPAKQTPAAPASPEQGVMPAAGARRRSRREAAAEPRFKPGDVVVARRGPFPGHTRLPRYAWGKRGVVERVHGWFTLPDSNAYRKGKAPSHVYAVRFAGSELWAEGAERDSVTVDLWEPYLEPAGNQPDR